MLALEAGQARRVPGSRPGRSVLAVTALSAAAVLALAACSGGSPAASAALPTSPGAASTSLPTAPAAVTQTLSETGSSLMAPLFARWAPAYHARFPQVTLRITTSSSGVGISSAAAGATDIGASDAYLSPADVTKYVHLVNIPLAVAALMVIYHIPDLSPSTHLKLNGQVLAQIFAGTITQWDAPAIRNLNPGVALPSSAIVPVHRSDASGSSFLFTSYLNAQDPADWSPSLIGTTVAWPAQPGGRGADGSDNMISTVGASPGAIGYGGVSYLAPVSQAGEGEAALANSAGRYVLPTPSTIQAGLASFTNTPDNGTISLINGSAAQAYPVINYEYAIVSTAQPSAALAQDLRAFLGWALTSGTAQLGPVNFQPLPASVVTQAQAQIAKITG
jgi:phosphate transport system substrate-binding protein